jgi:hypothetical protein
MDGRRTASCGRLQGATVLLRVVTTTGVAHANESTAPACSLTWTPRWRTAAALGHDGALRLDAEKRAWWMRLQGARAKDIAEAL